MTWGQTIYVIFGGGVLGAVAIAILAVAGSSPSTPSRRPVSTNPSMPGPRPSNPARNRPSALSPDSTIPGGAGASSDRNKLRRREDEVRNRELAIFEDARRTNDKAVQDAKDRLAEEQRLRLRAEDDARIARDTLEAERRRLEEEAYELRRRGDSQW